MSAWTEGRYSSGIPSRSMRHANCAASTSLTISNSSKRSMGGSPLQRTRRALRALASSEQGPEHARGSLHRPVAQALRDLRGPQAVDPYGACPHAKAELVEQDLRELPQVPQESLTSATTLGGGGMSGPSLAHVAASVIRGYPRSLKSASSNRAESRRSCVPGVRSCRPSRGSDLATVPAPDRRSGALRLQFDPQAGPCRHISLLAFGVPDRPSCEPHFLVAAARAVCAAGTARRVRRTPSSLRWRRPSVVARWTAS